MEMRKDSGRLMWGVVLLILGLILLLNNFGYGWWFGWGRWWPLILIGIGVWMLYRREGPWTLHPATPPAPAGPGTPAAPPGMPAAAGAPEEPKTALPARRTFPTGAVVLIGIGLAFLLDDVIGGNAFPALVLIVIGVALLLRERRA